MKLFTFIEDGSVHLARDKKVIPSDQFSTLLDAHEVLNKAKEKELAHFEKVKKKTETLREEAKKEGFEEGLKQFTGHIELLEKEIQKVRKEMENVLIGVATASVRKIIGKELQTRPEAVADIIATALKSVQQHRRITIYVNPADLENVEKQRGSLKALFEHLESLSIVPKEDLAPGGCTIETEAGIINASLDSQLNALESVFRTFFTSNQPGG